MEQQFAVGQAIFATEELDALPIGTEIGPDVGSIWRKVNATAWQHDASNQTTATSSFSMGGYNKIRTLPSPNNVVVLESLRQEQWRWLDHVYYSAEQSSVGLTVVGDSLSLVGITVDDFPLGAGVKIKSNYHRSRLPEGSVGYLGDPNNLRTYGVLRKVYGGSDWRLVLGVNSNVWGATMTVVSVPDGTVPEWAIAPGTEAEQDQIAEWKALAWRVGWKAKVHHRWCSSYESYMEQIGMTAEVLRKAKHNGVRIGERISPDIAASLPPGSVLRWRKSADPDTFAWFVRDDQVGNRAGTRKVFGSGEENRNYASSMEVLWIATDEGLAIPIEHAEARHLPPGARVVIDGNVYRIARDGQIASDSVAIQAVGSWRIDQFRPEALTVMSL